jgi:hypothetical protein
MFCFRSRIQTPASLTGSAPPFCLTPFPAAFQEAFRKTASVRFPIVESLQARGYQPNVTAITVIDQDFLRRTGTLPDMLQSEREGNGELALFPGVSAVLGPPAALSNSSRASESVSRVTGCKAFTRIDFPCRSGDR